jgi:L-methionine (R)-S-oxide reductase
MSSLASTDQAVPKSALYQRICNELGELLRTETDFIANAANSAAYLYQSVPDINWVGFYLLKGNELVLGPFAGKPACTRIAVGKGVCGTAAQQQKTVIVPDVDAFPGHIVCDTASRSEIVVPLLNWGKLLGVLDVDSASLDRFGDEDREGFESIAAVFLSSLMTDDMPDLSEEAIGR